MTDGGHLPVLLQQVLEGLALRPGETVIDCTAGRGGHASAMASQLGGRGTIMLLDRDKSNLEFAASRVRQLPECPRVVAVHADFRSVEAIARREGMTANAVLADLGFASNQVDDPERGLAFSRDGPLDMRLDQSSHPTASELLEEISEHELTDIIFRLGEDPFARAIARQLKRYLLEHPAPTTRELADQVVLAYGGRAMSSRIHPATRTFMALRMAVNDELGALEGLLGAVDRGARQTGSGQSSWLAAGARVCVISFHSLEDRPTKRCFTGLASEGLVQLAERKPTIASEVELAANPRSRSAKLRIARLLCR